MQSEELKSLIESSVENSEAMVSLEGNHAHVTVISPVFEGMMPVKKQQTVYACLQDVIASGAIHAVHMKTFTPSEWKAQSA